MENKTQRKVIRGGSWSADRNNACADYRLKPLPCFRFRDVGFRILREPLPTENQLDLSMTDIDTLQKKLEELQKQIKDLKNLPTLPKMIEISDRTYAVGKHPITFEEYNHYLTQTDKKPLESPGNNYPVVNVSWFDATDYCKWLSEKTGDYYRLPTEDEFEHFAGDHQIGTDETAVLTQSSCPPVCTKKPNKYGLYDVLGLVWEWQDNENKTQRKVLRGGSWYTTPDLARADSRAGAHPSFRSNFAGFRVLQETHRED